MWSPPSSVRAQTRGPERSSVRSTPTTRPGGSTATGSSISSTSFWSRSCPAGVSWTTAWSHTPVSPSSSSRSAGGIPGLSGSRKEVSKPIVASTTRPPVRPKAIWSPCAGGEIATISPSSKSRRRSNTSPVSSRRTFNVPSGSSAQDTAENSSTPIRRGTSRPEETAVSAAKSPAGSTSAPWNRGNTTATRKNRMKSTATIVPMPPTVMTTRETLSMIFTAGLVVRSRERPVKAWGCSDIVGSRIGGVGGGDGRDAGAAGDPEVDRPHPQSSRVRARARRLRGWRYRACRGLPARPRTRPGGSRP